MSPRLVMLVAMREARQRIASRAYIIFTLLLIFIAIGGVAGVRGVSTGLGTRRVTIGLEDPVSPGLRDSLARAGHDLSIEFRLRTFPNPIAGEDSLRAGAVAAFLTNDGRLEFKTQTDDVITAAVQAAVLNEGLATRAADLGLAPSQVQALLAPAAVKVAVLSPNDRVAAKDRKSRRIFASAVVVILYTSMAMYGSWVLMGVIEEKTSRVVEVLLGTLRAEELLSGKVLGILAAAMLQLLAGGAAIVAALLLSGSVSVPHVGPDVALVSAGFFVMGILLYSVLFAAIGATVSRPSEASSASMPVMISLLIPYLLSLTYIPSEPEAPLSRALSLFPFTASLAMPARLASGNPGALEIILAFGLMVPTVALATWAGSRIYAGAILRIGPRIGLIAALRAAFGSG